MVVMVTETTDAGVTVVMAVMEISMMADMVVDVMIDVMIEMVMCVNWDGYGNRSVDVNGNMFLMNDWVWLWHFNVNGYWPINWYSIRPINWDLKS